MKMEPFDFLLLLGILFHSTHVLGEKREIQKAYLLSLQALCATVGRVVLLLSP